MRQNVEFKFRRYQNAVAEMDVDITIETTPDTAPATTQEP